MKKLVLTLAVLFIATAAFAGGAGCDKSAAKAVKLAGTIECADGDCSKAKLVSNDGKYTICSSSKAKLTSLNGAKVKVSGKLVNCSEGGGEELVVESVSKI